MNNECGNSKSIKIVINADDFGLNTSVNRAIADAFGLGIISSTTMVTNMSGFAEACEISKAYKLNGRIGVHLNLTEGQPLTEHIRQCKRFCNSSGSFKKILAGRHLYFSRKERNAVFNELKAQIEMCEKQGITPTHIDSHHHSHTSIGIAPFVIKLASLKNISAVRINNNCAGNIPMYQKAYKAFYNMVLYLFGLTKTDYFCSINDIKRVFSILTTGSVEIMVHPTYSGGGRLIDSQNQQFLIDQLYPLKRYSLYSFATLTDIRRPKFININIEKYL